MKHFLFGTPEPDPELRDSLRPLARDSSQAEDDALRDRITLAAEPALRARRASARQTSRPWWEWTSGWARLALPAGAAVALASALLVTRVSVPVSTEVDVDSVAASSFLVSAGADQSDAGLMDQVLAPAEQDWLFSEALVGARPGS